MMILGQIPPLLAIAGLLAIFFGVTFGLYAILTKAQPRTTREIREAAAEQGWQYRLQRWRRKS